MNDANDSTSNDDNDSSGFGNQTTPSNQFGGYVQAVTVGFGLGYNTEYGVGLYGFHAVSAGVESSYWGQVNFNFAHGVTYSHGPYAGIGTVTGTPGVAATLETGLGPSNRGNVFATVGTGVTDLAEVGVFAEVNPSTISITPNPYGNGVTTTSVSDRALNNPTGFEAQMLGALARDDHPAAAVAARQFVYDDAVIRAVVNPPIKPKIRDPYTSEQRAQLDALPDDFCFLEGTMVDMWPADLKPELNKIYNEQEVLANVWQKPIEEVTPQDWVLSYDDIGRLKPGRVTRTFQNHSKHILDLHGLMITPGHATYCAKVDGEENRFAGKHVPIIDILRSDGALKKNDGTLIRAATGCEIGLEDDEQFWAFLLCEDADGIERVRDKCQLRYGTRWMLPNGNHYSMREYLEGSGVEIIKAGPHKGYARFKKTGVCSVFAWTLSESLPKPEDYVLQRSQVTLEEIYEADEWEAVGPQIPAPFIGEAGRSYKRDVTPYTGIYAGAASSDHLPPNIPYSMRDSANQPTMSRKQRRAMESKQRKGGKQPRNAQSIH